VQKIKDGLVTILPNRSALISQNTATYLAQINETEQELQNLIATAGFQDRKIISMEWQKDFLQDLGLNVTYYYGPPEGLSVQDELDVFDAASQDDISAIVDNLQSGTDFGARISSETGVSHVIFTNFPGAIPGADTYLEMVAYNTDQIIKGMQTHDQVSHDTQALRDQVSSLSLQRNLFVIVSVIAILFCLLLYIMYIRKDRR
jgi:ABC-type Zn uptake system ZnuABC Zn-binding protein ZnuA